MNSKIIFATLLAFTAALFGQDENADSTTGTLEEISVKGVNMSELGLTGSSLITTDQVEDRQIKSIADLSGLAPNFYVNSSGQQSFGDVITLRGIGNTQIFGDPAVSLYVDGVPAGSTSTYSSTLFEVESVEVLSGSQGHQFGKNSPGGVINIKTRRPGTNHRSKLYASYGTFDTQSYRVLADGPTGEKSSYYFGINRSESGGFSDNSDPLGNDATSESWNGRFGFNWVTNEGIEIGLGATWEKFDLGAQPIVPRTSSGNGKFTNFYTRNSAENEISKISSNSQYLKLSKLTNIGKVSSITSINDWKLDPSFLDLTFVDSTLANADLNFSGLISSTSEIKDFRKHFNQNFELSSEENIDNPWKIGANLSVDNYEGTATRFFPDASGNLETQTTYSEIETDYYSLYGLKEIALSEKIYFEIGARVDLVKRSLDRSKNISDFNPFSRATTNSSSPRIMLSDDSELFSPSIKITHELSESTSSFFKVGYSEKAGGYSAYVDADSPFLGTISNFEFNKERIFSHEIGLLFKNENWALNLCAFSNDISDYQFEKPTGTTDYFVDNAEEVQVFGIELDFSVNPSERLLLNLKYGVTDGEIIKHSGSNFNYSTSSVDTHDFAGKQIPFSPEYSFYSDLSYLLSDNLTATIGVNQVGDIHYLDQTATDTVNDSYTLLNANFGYMRNGWEVNLFGTNLTDEEYYTSLVSSLTGVPGVVGSPRVVGLSVSREF
ncbi:MAG: hypothetical protein CMI27_02770 [Opitutae bacterium]|nr:hypothetical protein [Opitutae bacterium]